MMWCSHLRYRNFITPNNILQKSKVQRHAASISNLCTVNSWDACLQRRLLSTSDSLQTLCRHLQPSDCDCSSVRRITIGECKRICESRNILEWGGRGHPPCNKLWYQRYMQLQFAPGYCCPEMCLCNHVLLQGLLQVQLASGNCCPSFFAHSLSSLPFMIGEHRVNPRPKRWSFGWCDVGPCNTKIFLLLPHTASIQMWAAYYIELNFVYLMRCMLATETPE